MIGHVFRNQRAQRVSRVITGSLNVAEKSMRIAPPIAVVVLRVAMTGVLGPSESNDGNAPRKRWLPEYTASSDLIRANNFNNGCTSAGQGA